MAGLVDRQRQLLDVRSWVAFDIDASGRVLAGTDELGSVQLVEIGTDGVRNQLTNLPSRCAGRYICGTRQVVVMHDNGGDERMQLSLLDADRSEPANLDDLRTIVADPLYMHVLHDVDQTTITYSTNRRNGVDMDVVVRELDGGTERVVYDGGGYVDATEVSHDKSSVAVTAESLQPSSTHIILAGPRAPSDRPFTDPNEHAEYSNVHWAPDDQSLIVSCNHDRDFAAITQIPLDGSAWSVLVEDPDHDLRVLPSPDGSALLVSTNVDGADRIAIHNADGTKRCDVDLERTIVVDGWVWAPDSSRALLTASGPTSPGLLVAIDATDGEKTTVIDGRNEIDPQLLTALSEPTCHRIPTADGEQIPCFVYRPAGVNVDEHVDGGVVVHVHGGPEAQARRFWNPSIAALVASGLTVIQPNVRGSAGYGKRWVSLDDVRLRLDSVADLKTINQWLPSVGLDPQRAALWGGSYGGYMVLAGTTMQPDLWAAGVDIVGMSSLVTFLENTSGYRRAYREREYGSLANDRDFLLKASPITYLDQLRAPLFVIHGANDPRVPLSEAEQITAALQTKGIACELRVYADEGHGLAKRANRLDAYIPAFAFLRDQLAR